MDSGQWIVDRDKAGPIWLSSKASSGVTMDASTVLRVNSVAAATSLRMTYTEVEVRGEFGVIGRWVNG